MEVDHEPPAKRPATVAEQSKRSASGGPLTLDGHRRNLLNKARMAQFIRVASSDDAKAFVSDLTHLTIEHETTTTPRKRKRRAADLANFQKATGAFSADLLSHSTNAEADGFMYRAANRAALGDTLVSSDFFDQLVKFWLPMGLMEATGFIRIKEEWEGQQLEKDAYAKARRFRATPALMALAEAHGLTPTTVKEHFSKDMGRVTLVTVRDERRDGNGRRLHPRTMKMKGKRYDAETERVKRINVCLSQAGFDLKDTPSVFRLFNRGNWDDFDFNMGGRLYCASEDNWQQMPKEQRSKITCHGERTVELDVRASHLFILYRLQGRAMPVEEDPYFIPGVKREVVKAVFAATTGSGELPTRWPQEFAKDYKAKTGRAVGDDYRPSAIVKKLLQRHPVIETIKYGKLEWAQLQYEESECFMAAIRELWEHFEVGALPVHDSIIVAERHRKVAEVILGQTYMKRFGHRPYIRAE